MAQMNPKITIRSVYFGILLLSAAVMISAVRLTVASELNSLEAAAEQGDATVQLNLGVMYANGEGVPQNDTEAVRWFRMAAEQGIAEAQSKLGFMYLNGRGIPKNDTEAVRWFRMATEQGFAEAAEPIYMAAGQGIAEAVRWVRESAEQGNVKAQFNLGVMYANGRGVPKDYVQAYAWFNIAAAQGNKEAKEVLENITKEMSTAGITKAQELSREYWEAYGPNRALSE